LKGSESYEFSVGHTMILIVEKEINFMKNKWYVDMLKSGQTLFTNTSSVNYDKNKRFNVAFVLTGKNKIKVKHFSYFI
jgi:hypothetical protein